jgi:hypothetical protein
MAEYSLLLTLLAILCVGAITLLALTTTGAFDKAGDGFVPTPTSTPTPEDEPPVTTPGGPGVTAPATTLPPCVPPETPDGGDCTTTTQP